MNKTTKANYLGALAVSLMLTAGCEQNTSDAEKKVSETREKTTETGSDLNAMAKTKEPAKAAGSAGISVTESKAKVASAKADFEVAMNHAQDVHDIAEEKCNSLKLVAKETCLSAIAATLATAETTATATRDRAMDAADMQF